MGHNKKIFEKNLRVKPPHPPQKNTQQYVTNIFPKNIWWNWGPLFINLPNAESIGITLQADCID
jgi:hypothetical protein